MHESNMGLPNVRFTPESDRKPTNSDRPPRLSLFPLFRSLFGEERTFAAMPRLVAMGQKRK
jgi:hypothetical protein